MTTEEAIKELRERYELGKKEFYENIPEYVDALGMAIKALEKQIPKQPFYKEPTDKLENGYDACSVCGNAVGVFEYRDNYCSNCGQAIDWSDK